MINIWFAWYPVKLYKVTNGIFVFIRYAWLEKVERVETLYSGTRYFEVNIKENND